MNRLAGEHRRLFLDDHAASAQQDATQGGAASRTRAMVLGVPGAGGWNALSRVWRGVQADLQCPAPGIAVSGGGHELWFSVSQPVPIAQAQAFLESLLTRYLGDVPPHRVRMMLREGAQSLPPRELEEGRWSAFVSADLAGLFTDEPWLDIPPGDDAQAELLSTLQSMSPEDLERALAQDVAPAAEASLQAQRPWAAAEQHADPRSFLLAVMNDAAAPLHLRIEAAKALLPYPAASPGA